MEKAFELYEKWEKEGIDDCEMAVLLEELVGMAHEVATMLKIRVMVPMKINTDLYSTKLAK